MDISGASTVAFTRPGKSGQAIGHIAKAAVAEAKTAGVDLPENAQGMAASAIAKGADPASIFAALVQPDPVDPPSDDTGLEPADPISDDPATDPIVDDAAIIAVEDFTVLETTDEDLPDLTENIALSDAEAALSLLAEGEENNNLFV